MNRYQCILVGSCLIILLAASFVLAQPKSIPIDIPGTNVHFFSLRYEGDTPPYDKAHLIWERLNTVFLDWVNQGQSHDLLNTDMVSIDTMPDGSVAILLKGNFIVGVDSYHASINKATTHQLAKMWADNLRKGVAVFTQTNVLKP